jgi:hypothetical protein
MKYPDGKYHIEYIKHEYLGGYEQSDWTIVNAYGEQCTKDGVTLRFGKKEDAERYCAKINICPEGAAITELG